MNLANISTVLFDFVYKLSGVVLSLLAVFSIFWYIKSYKKINILEKKIFDKQKEHDDMEQITHQKTRGTVNQGQLDAMVAKNRKPVEKELNLLKMERQFILDKLPLVGFFKK